ncbi:MAG: SPOR domain-containing protein [Spirochaetaceae bacterium]|jgi:hypothetical protein|nr:SPOR domain-containing protein [Spirochaetaceae bacterium]
MKKNNIAPWASWILPAVLIFVGASVWEGSAAVSVAGELPEGAYYVATNSFPRNTVVDVTNLENGRTIRVIVAAGLDSPGLLAMLSRNAASAIGVQPRTIGRIRMTQPSDPVAFSRFTEESELPEGAAPVTAPNPVVSSTLRTATAGDLASSTPEDRFYSSIINRPEAYVPPAVAYPQDGSVHAEPQPAWITEDPERGALITETPNPAVPPPAYESPIIAVPGPDPAYPQPMLTAPAPQTAGPAQPPPNTPLNSTPYAWQVSPPYIAPPAAAPALAPDSVITLEPAEERPPQGMARELLPVPPPPRQAPRPESGRSPGDDTYLDPRYFIGPIPQLSGPAQPPARIVNPPPPAPKTAEPAQNGSIFSVPIITRLENGKQYVQIGAFTRPDTLETAVARARRSYPLAVQTGGSNNTLVYRLLIGPLNAGESAAVAQRVRNSGFPDAFIRVR